MKRKTLGGKLKLIFEPKEIPDPFEEIHNENDEIKDKNQSEKIENKEIKIENKEIKIKKQIKKIIKNTEEINNTPIQIIKEFEPIKIIEDNQIEPLEFKNENKNNPKFGNIFLIQIPYLKNSSLFKKDDKYFIKSDNGIFKLDIYKQNYKIVKIDENFEVLGDVNMMFIGNKVD